MHAPVRFLIVASSIASDYFLILDYFNMLEQSCEMVEDILIMPQDLQADVIVPIVNFMYTGTLEFHYNMYEKLLKTSREMNMTVLSKLLEAHRQTSVTAVKQSTQPVLLNKNATGVRSQPKVFYQKPSPAKSVFYKQGQTIIKHVSSPKPNIPEPIQIVTRFQPDKNNSRPSRFIVPDEIVPDSEGTFESISYESKPLLTASQVKREEENSPFESLRRGYTNNKRVASTSSSQSPPTKKPNLDDIKAEAEAQRQRNEISGDGEELDDNASDPDYDADQYFEEENDDSEDESNKNFKNSSGTVVKQTTKQITVNDCSGGNIDHAKILGEVLKKYPNLVKNPKNIKLKIMQKPSHPNSQQTTAIVRVVKQESPSGKTMTTTLKQTSPAISTQPKKIDAKTMHELIRMGAENMKGPWLCLDCGSGGRPISIPTYKKFRAHLVNVHKQKIDPRVCEHCGLKPARRIELIQHQLISHNINPPADVPLFRCTTKNCVFVTQKEELLMKHKREVHKEFQQKCKYCPKVFGKEFLLHAHMRAVHRHMSKTDGSMEYSEDEEYEPAGSSKDGQFSEITLKKTNKIEILSNIEIPASESLKFEVDGTIVSQPSSEAEALTSVASGIATSLSLADNDDQFNIEQQLAQVHGEYEDGKKDNSGLITKLVAEDGTELELTAAQKEEILQQLQSQGATLSDNVVMVLDQGQLNVESENNIMVMYSESQTTISSESLTTSAANTLKPEELEKAEIVFQDDTVETKEKQIESEKSKLISDLEDDWTEDDEGSQNDSKLEPEESKTNESQGEEQFELLPEPDQDEKASEVKKPEEANGKLKDILDDWQDDENDLKSGDDEEVQDTSETLIEAKDDSQSQPEPESEVVANDDKIADAEISTDKELPEQCDDVPVLESTDETKKAQQTASTTEKSKIISDLLEEWNDDDL